jgi:hypothetical protein
LAGKIIDFWNGTNPVLHFSVKGKKGKGSLMELEVKQLVHCGRTSRNQLKLPQHVALAPSSAGERRPVHGAIAFLVPQVNATHSRQIVAYDMQNNAEVEPVFFFDSQENLFVTVGSDHADRYLESTAGPKSKLWMPKVMSKQAWYYQDVEDHWDEIVLRMWGYVDNVRQLYMDSTVGQILPVEDLLNVTREQCRLKDLRNTVIFGGSVPFLTEGPLWGIAWDFEMFDPILKRTIGHHYDVELAWR